MAGFRYAALPLAGVFGMAACGGSSAGSSGMTVDTLPGGTVRVSNTRPAWTSETAWRLEGDLRLGTAGDARPAEQFTEIRAILTDSTGAIYVLDGQAQEVRVFRPDGTFSRRIGRRGQGPGELWGAAGLNLGPDGRLWVWDPGQAGYSVFQLDGTFVTRHQRLVSGVVFPWRGEFGPDGHLYDWSIAFPGREAGPTAARVVFQPIRVSKDFASIDSLPPIEQRRDASGNIGAVPFTPRLTFYQDRAGAIWFANTGEYAIRRRTLEGDTTLVFTLPATPAPVTEAERDSVLEGNARVPPEFRFRREDVPDLKPVLQRLFGDDAGHVFVVPELNAVPAGSAVDVFKIDGRYLGRIELPQTMVLPLPAPHATRNHLYVVVRDELDVLYVSRFRIVRPA
jgi:hypothetical protein